MTIPIPSPHPGSREPVREHPPSHDPSAAEEAIARQAAAWLQMFSRALKTWRLYDENNPMVLQFRAQLHAALWELLEAHGALTLCFTADKVSCAGIEIHHARTRDDQLSMVFFRDGIHALTFAPGMAQEELDLLLGHVVRMGVRAKDHEDDLVTLLWEAELPHLDMQYVSAEADFDLVSEDPMPGHATHSGPPMAFPRGGGGAEPETSTASQQQPPGTSVGVLAAVPLLGSTRSEDWTASDPTTPLQDELDQIEAVAEAAVRQFHAERAAEQAENRGDVMLALLEDAMRCGLDDSERALLGPNVAEILHDALASARWAHAARAVQTLRSVEDAASERARWEALARPESVITRTVVRLLDAQSQQEIGDFFELARKIGPTGLDWLITILAESQQQRVRRPLARTIAEIADGDVEQISHRLEDPRWYLVRNLILALHAIGGERIVAPLGKVLSHPDRRVRLEVLAALGSVPVEHARPLLISVIRTDDVRELSGALRMLATGPDPEVARLMLERVMSDDFAQRSPDEQRAVLSALGATGDDSTVPLLVTLLDPARRPNAACEEMLPGVARCLARLGSPTAIAALRSAMGSRWQATREAASLVLAATRAR